MSHQDDIKKLIHENQRRLQKLKEMQARSGASTAPEILLEIEDIETKIKKLKAELEQIEKNLPPENSEDASNTTPKTRTPLSDSPRIKIDSKEAVPLRRLRVFLCHSSEDKEDVRKLYHRLRNDGVEPWFDEENLLPGQDWRFEIPKAVRSSDVVIVCLSNNSTVPGGYIHEEIEYALNIADRQPEGTIFIIPLRLEDCRVPQRLRRWHWVNLFVENGYERLMRSLRARAHEQGILIIPGAERRERRIDAAIPSYAEVGQPIDLMIQVRFPDSPLLGIKDWPTKLKLPAIEQESEPIKLEFPMDSKTGTLGSAQLSIRVVTPDFKIDGVAQQIVEVPPAQDSKRVLFLLTPKKTGICRINVEVYSLDHIYLGVIPIETSVEEINIKPSVNVANLFLVVIVRERSEYKTRSPLTTKPPIKDKISKLVRDPAWQAIGVFVAIVALGVAIYATFFTEGKASNATTPTNTVSIIAARETNTPTNTVSPTFTASPSSSSTNTLIPLPLVKKFSVNPSVIIEGESVNIVWEVEGADTISIEHIGDQLPLEESLTLSPTETISYVLKAFNESGQIEPIARQVFVTPAPTIAPNPPTITPMLTPTLTPTPTNTPTIAPPTATLTATLTPTLELPEGRFASLKILQANNETYGPTDFEWQWVGPIPPDTGFEVRIWREGKPPQGVHNSVLDNQPNGAVKKIGENTYELNADITTAPGVREGGDYSWTVVLVQIFPEYQDLGIQAEPGQLHFVGQGGDGGGGGGGDGGGGGGGIVID